MALGETKSIPIGGKGNTIMEIIKLEVQHEDDGKRLDSYINSKVETISRSHVQKLIEEQLIKVDGLIQKSSYKIKKGQGIELNVPEPKKLELIAQDIPVQILYEDEDLVVVNKPKGMVVHPACGNYEGTLVNALLHQCSHLSSINGVIRPGIVHRIDKDTSGVLVVAKNDNAHMKLSEQFKEHSIKRRYVALVYGNIKTERGTINAPIGRHKTERKKMAIIAEGRSAVTHFEVIERFEGYSLIEATLETGRTHQIRVHMTYIGHSVAGDEVYGPKKQKIKTKGQMLHAELLGFIHPVTGEYLEFEAPLPEEFKEVLKKVR